VDPAGAGQGVHRVSKLSDEVVAELVARYSPKQKPNPAWDRKVERAAWVADEEYDVPQYVDRTPEEMAKGDTCMVVEDGADGCSIMRALTFAEIAAVVEAVEER
jgi:hypothetical protein